MNEFQRDVRMEGFDLPIGCLARDFRNALAFAYDPEYANRADAVPLSLSLPLDGTEFPGCPDSIVFREFTSGSRKRRTTDHLGLDLS